MYCYSIFLKCKLNIPPQSIIMELSNQKLRTIDIGDLYFFLLSYYNNLAIVYWNDLNYWTILIIIFLILSIVYSPTNDQSM